MPRPTPGQIRYQEARANEMAQRNGRCPIVPRERPDLPAEDQALRTEMFELHAAGDPRWMDCYKRLKGGL